MKKFLTDMRRGGELVDVCADGGNLRDGDWVLVVAVADLENGDHLFPVDVSVLVWEAALLDYVHNEKLVWEVGFVEEQVRHDGGGTGRDPEFEFGGCHLDFRNDWVLFVRVSFLGMGIKGPGLMNGLLGLLDRPGVRLEHPGARSFICTCTWEYQCFSRSSQTVKDWGWFCRGSVVHHYDS